jgi:hypothetical protein
VWIDARNFPPVQLIGINRIGDDPLIGQDPKATQQGWPRIWGEPRDIDFNFGGYVTLQGGEYFFAPSLTFLKNIVHH